MTVYRERLPETRNAKTTHFKVYDEGHIYSGYLTVGEYKDGRPGEIFIRLGKAGGTIATECPHCKKRIEVDTAMYDQWAIAFSLLLQQGTNVDILCQKFIGTRFQPAGPTNVPEAGICTSIIDLVCRWLKARYGSLTVEGELSPDAVLEMTAQHFGISRAAILQADNHAKLAQPRQIAMYLARELTGLSFAKLGLIFRRDHSTVVHAHRHVLAWLETDDKIRAEVAALVAKLRPIESKGK